MIMTLEMFSSYFTSPLKQNKFSLNKNHFIKPKKCCFHKDTNFLFENEENNLIIFL